MICCLFFPLFSLPQTYRFMAALPIYKKDGVIPPIRHPDARKDGIRQEFVQPSVDQPQVLSEVVASSPPHTHEDESEERTIPIEVSPREMKVMTMVSPLNNITVSKRPSTSEHSRPPEASQNHRPTSHKRLHLDLASRIAQPFASTSSPSSSRATSLLRNVPFRKANCPPHLPLAPSRSFRDLRVDGARRERQERETRPTTAGTEPVFSATPEVQLSCTEKVYGPRFASRQDNTPCLVLT